MALTNEQIVAAAKAVNPNVTSAEHHGDLTVIVPRESLIDVLTELRDNPATSFSMLIDVTAIDRAEGPERFEVYYFLSSLEHSARVRVMTKLREDNLHIPTSTEVWESANWYERETYDMYGIVFDGHPDMRRFYMPEDFMDADGTPLYPLRKDFPLMGIPGSLPLPPKE
jgi:NADH-quinone oxidoreductase subunit C